jgi:hypothetical protein
VRSCFRRALFLALSLVAPVCASAADITLAWDANAEPDVAGYVVYVGTTPGVYTETEDVGTATMHVYSGGQAGTTYYFAVAAYAEGRVEGEKSPAVSVTVPGKPSMASPGDQLNTVGDVVGLQLAASAPGGHAVTYDATQLPFDLRLNASTGLIAGTLTSSSTGTYSTTVRAMNALDPSQVTTHVFAWVVRPQADTLPPQVLLVMPTSGAPHRTSSMLLTIAGTASDDTGVTEVTWSNDRGGAGTAAGTLAWTADLTLQPGVNTVTVTARDAANNRASAT